MEFYITRFNRGKVVACFKKPAARMSRSGVRID